MMMSSMNTRSFAEIPKDRPLIVGAVTTAEGFQRISDGWTPSECDWVEFRADLLDCPHEDILAAAERLMEQGTGALYTLRLAAEGGQWTDEDALREERLRDASTRMTAVDVEAASPICASVVATAEQHGCRAVVSFHDFDGTPSLEEMLSRFQSIQGAGVVLKAATHLHSTGDILTLAHLIQKLQPRPVCVMGMGDLGPRSRIALSALGSCLLYGYLDASAAPGQLSCTTCRELVESLFVQEP